MEDPVLYDTGLCKASAAAVSASESGGLCFEALILLGSLPLQRHTHRMHAYVAEWASVCARMHAMLDT